MSETPPQTPAWRIKQQVEEQSLLAGIPRLDKQELTLAKVHIDLAAAALKVAGQNDRVIAVAVGHLEDAIKALRPGIG